MQLAPSTLARLGPWLQITAKLLAVAGLSIFFVRLLDVYQRVPSLNLLLLLIGESVTLLLVLLARAPKEVAVNVKTCVLTGGATFYFLAVDMVDGVALVPGWFSQGMQAFGIIWQIVAKLYLGRRFGLLPANRGIIDYGPYRIVRHPIYFGYLIMHVGYVLSAFSWRNIVVYTLLYILQINRLLEEEKVLSRSESYRDYQTRVRYRLVPGVF